MISAHQLCSCRMGKDPATSVADTNGELRDVKGVWIGDGSACPTSLGANPMVTIMALAERTADKMMTGSSRRDFDVMPAIPDLALNMIRGMVSMMTNPTNMIREMAGIMTNPAKVFTLGERLLSGRLSAESAAPAGNDSTPGKTREGRP